MPKDIVLLLDGTSNEISSNRSNILRLYGSLQKNESQLVYYDPGVGTFGAENAWSQTIRKGNEVWGMATGWGFDANVKEAYRFLVRNYDRGANPDRIHLIGFSRGAYCARVLAGFLHAFGLMEERNLNLLNYAFRAYKRIDANARPEDYAELSLHQRILRPHRPLIRFLGLFDTVSSMIESGRFLPRLRKHGFTDRNPSVQTMRHALAIDERRTMFRPQLWPEDQPFDPSPETAGGSRPQDAREVWFTGSHGDIGGGYPEAQSALAKLPLKWMIDHSREAGLKYNSDVIEEIVMGGNPQYAAPNGLADVTNSMSTGWRLLEFLPRKTPVGSLRANFAGWSIPQSEARSIPAGARVHRSVVARYDQYPRPPQLPFDIIEET